jgi:glyoxylase-like metal-dependent hydrolase (beta-lactamase superfamily II)
MLYCREDKIFFAADQIMLKISPNISVSVMDPEGDPLGCYLRSLGEVKNSIPDGVLVLPGHKLPFTSLHNRIDELVEHHEMRCQIIEDACRNASQTTCDLVPLLFHRPLDDHQMTFAFTEALAHVNMMIKQGRLIWAEAGDIWRAKTA